MRWQKAEPPVMLSCFLTLAWWVGAKSDEIDVQFVKPTSNIRIRLLCAIHSTAHCSNQNCTVTSIKPPFEKDFQCCLILYGS